MSIPETRENFRQKAVTGARLFLSSIRERGALIALKTRNKRNKQDNDTKTYHSHGLLRIGARRPHLPSGERTR
jgi:hypothetical protein